MGRKAVAGLVFALWSCGDNLHGLPLEEAAATRLQAECARLVRCGLFQDLATCEAYFPTQDLAELRSAAAAQRIEFDGVRAERCYRALEGISCDVTTEEARVLPADCARIFVGSVAGGESCQLDEECASRRCTLPVCSRQECCVGTCDAVKEAAPIGGACERTDDCVQPAFCDADKRCHGLITAGLACRNDRECTFGLACIGAGIDPGACRPLPLRDEPCPYLRCAELGATCSSTTGTCVSAGPGAACASDVDCSSFTLCDLPSSRCVPVPTLGMPCVTRCAGDSWCDHDATPTTCAAQFAVSSPCRSDDQCSSRLCEEGPVFDFCAAAPVCF